MELVNHACALDNNTFEFWLVKTPDNSTEATVQGYFEHKEIW